MSAAWRMAPLTKVALLPEPPNFLVFAFVAVTAWPALSVNSPSFETRDRLFQSQLDYFCT
jgi:hypothetical protein